MTIDDRLNKLEHLVGTDAPSGVPIVLFDPDDVPKDAAGRDRYFAERRGASETTIFIPDNGRDSEEPDEACQR
jgi:hypothetical protein